MKGLTDEQDETMYRIYSAIADTFGTDEAVKSALTLAEVGVALTPQDIRAWQDRYDEERGTWDGWCDDCNEPFASDGACWCEEED